MSANASWHLEDFVDSLVVELDKTRETLAVKAINKPLSYTVREVALDLNIFPTYDGDQVTFTTAAPGQEGASKVTIQLGTITDQQVRATSKAPVAAKDAINLNATTIDADTKKKLRRIGVTSADDLKQIEKRNVDLHEVTDDTIDYTKLANQIEQSRRAQSPPKVRSASLEMENGRPCIVVRGENLAINPLFPPVAMLNEQLVDVTSSGPGEVRVAVEPHRIGAINDLAIVVDPFALFRMRLSGTGGIAQKADR